MTPRTAPITLLLLLALTGCQGTPQQQAADRVTAISAAYEAAITTALTLHQAGKISDDTLVKIDVARQIVGPAIDRAEAAIRAGQPRDAGHWLGEAEQALGVIRRALTERRFEEVNDE